MFGVLLLLVILAVRLNVLFSYQQRPVSGLQKAFEGIAMGNDKVKNLVSTAFGCRS